MREEPFTDLLEATVDNRGKTAPTAPTGIPLIATNCIKEDCLYPVFEKVRYIDDQTYRTWFRGHPEPGDILFVCKGSPGRVALVPDPVSFCIAQDMVAVRADPKKVYPKYLLAALKSPIVRERVAQMHVGTMIPHFKKGDFDKLLIPVPDADSQRQIGDLFFELCEKVESNRRVIHTESQLAVALLSQGGRLLRVGDIATISKGMSYKGSGLDDGNTSGAVPMVNLANFAANGQINIRGLKHYIGEYKPKHILQARDLLVANTDLTQAREILGRGFLVPPRLAGAIHTHHTSLIRFDDDKNWMTFFVWAQLHSDEFRNRAKGFATGTTVAALPADALLDFEISIPDDASKVVSQAVPLLEHSWHLLDENACITAARDVLMSGLLSGQVRIAGGKDAGA